ncbi:hypothetical protein HAX54_018171, partial [Datura stramonium]|nr:hypothetical protein [Datura stramonium]
PKQHDQGGDAQPKQRDQGRDAVLIQRDARRGAASLSSGQQLIPTLTRKRSCQTQINSIKE